VIAALTPAGTALSAWGVIAFLAVIGLGVACLVVAAIAGRRQAADDDGVPAECHRCGGPLPANTLEWWLSDGVHCSKNCADGIITDQKGTRS
jgi:hypothetical protein